MNLNKHGGFDSIEDAEREIGPLSGSSIGAVAESGKEPEAKIGKILDRDAASTAKLADKMDINEHFTPGASRSTFIPNERAEILKNEFGIELNYDYETMRNLAYAMGYNPKEYSGGSEEYLKSFVPKEDLKNLHYLQHQLDAGNLKKDDLIKFKNLKEKYYMPARKF